MPSLETSSLSSKSKSWLPVVLSIAGYDPSAGAGVLGDLKTFAANGVYGMACITALTVQSSQGVQRVKALDPNLVIETLDCLERDVQFASVKVGMLGQSPVALAVVDWLQRRPTITVVLDPVLKSSYGKDLLDKDGLQVLREKWLARANWITPNLPELQALIGEPFPRTHAGIEAAADRLLQMATQRGNPGLKIVVTGGHAKEPDDLFHTGAGSHWYPGQHVETESTHGTGCAFSSALASRLARGEDDFSSVQAAKEYVAESLRTAYPVGKGNGPLNHLWKLNP